MTAVDRSGYLSSQVGSLGLVHVFVKINIVVGGRQLQVLLGASEADEDREHAQAGPNHPQLPLHTWQTAGLLWQQVLIGVEQSRTGDHDGAIDVHQVLTLLHSDTTGFPS